MLSRISMSTKAARVLGARSTKPLTSTSIRAFHSPFPALSSSSSPLTGSKTHTTPEAINVRYEKAEDHSPDPEMSHTGTRTYVVSQPDPADTPYEVPSGAFPTSAPYVNYAGAFAPGEVPKSSSSASPAHPATTRRVPVNESGVGESAAVRHRSAPGEMGARGGGHYGTAVMDKDTTKPGSDGELADRNPPPLSAESEEFSNKGLKDAWKARK